MEIFYALTFSSFYLDRFITNNIIPNTDYPFSGVMTSQSNKIKTSQNPPTRTRKKKRQYPHITRSRQSTLMREYDNKIYVLDIHKRNEIQKRNVNGHRYTQTVNPKRERAVYRHFHCCLRLVFFFAYPHRHRTDYARDRCETYTRNVYKNS